MVGFSVSLVMLAIGHGFPVLDEVDGRRSPAGKQLREPVNVAVCPAGNTPPLDTQAVPG
jgi:hypothetical protein